MSRFSYHRRAQPYSPADYGWDEAWDHAFSPSCPAGPVPARIVRAGRGSCEAATDAGILRAEIPGLPGGSVLRDTPGLRAIGLHDVRRGLERTFAEIELVVRGCRFTDCGHGGEPGCAVPAAVGTGEIRRRRLDSYHRLLRENDYAASLTDTRLRAGREAAGKDIAQHLRATYRFRDRQR